MRRGAFGKVVHLLPKSSNLAINTLVTVVERGATRRWPIAAPPIGIDDKHKPERSHGIATRFASSST